MLDVAVVFDAVLIAVIEGFEAAIWLVTIVAGKMEQMRVRL